MPDQARLAKLNIDDHSDILHVNRPGMEGKKQQFHLVQQSRVIKGEKDKSKNVNNVIKGKAAPINVGIRIPNF